MKCIYYLTSTLDSCNQISDDLHQTGVKDWFIHILSKDEAGLTKRKLHSSNYLEQIDLLRFSIIGTFIGLILGLFSVFLMKVLQPFGPDVPNYAYYGVIAALTLFGAWEGGLTGIASENRKISHFHNEIEAGKYLILIYAREKYQNAIKTMMLTQHPEARIVAEDGYFFNPLSDLKRI